MDWRCEHSILRGCVPDICVGGRGESEVGRKLRGRVGEIKGVIGVLGGHFDWRYICLD